MGCNSFAKFLSNPIASYCISPFRVGAYIRSITSYRIRDISRRSFESSEAISKRSGWSPVAITKPCGLSSHEICNI
ncbi:MAG TPA: hypothetical protein VF623_01705 [Segetibacter sp.]